MKKSLAALSMFFILFFSGLPMVHGGMTMGREDSQLSVCPGTWVLEYKGWWQVRQNDRILSLDASTRVLGCRGEKITFSPELSGLKVAIKCRIEDQEGKKVYFVTEVRLICE